MKRSTAAKPRRTPVRVATIIATASVLISPGPLAAARTDPALAWPGSSPALTADATPEVSDAGTEVVVTVTRAVLVVLDNGVPVRAMSNFTIRPTASDAFYIYGDGHTPAPLAAKAAVLRVAPGQNWTHPGVWHTIG